MKVGSVIVREYQGKLHEIMVVPDGFLWQKQTYTSLSTIALAAGRVLSVITKSLYEIRKWLPDAGLSNLKLFPESSDRILVEQMNGRTDKIGQFALRIR